MATKNRTQSSCARFKVEVYLLGEFPKCIKIGIKKEDGNVSEKWTPIKYDYLPKYCETCLIQGHDKTQYYVKNLELFKRKKESQKEEKEGD